MKTFVYNEIAKLNIFNAEAMKKTNENVGADEPTITVRATIGDKEVEFTPAFTDYSMEHPKKKDALLKNTVADKRMEVIFHFATPEVFWNEGVTIFDRNGKTISKDTPNVLVACDMADTYWRLFLDEVLTNVQIHQFESVQEYAQVVGNSVLLSRGLSNIFTVQRINVILKEVKRKYRLHVGNFSCHSLRKTFGRQVYTMNDNNAELALVKLMELFNHSNVAITKRYLGLRQEEILQTYDCLSF